MRGPPKYTYFGVAPPPHPKTIGGGGETLQWYFTHIILAENLNIRKIVYVWTGFSWMKPCGILVETVGLKICLINNYFGPPDGGRIGSLENRTC